MIVLPHIEVVIKTDANVDYSKMRLKQLRQILRERGVACRGCVEKSDFVRRAKETAHMEL